MSALPVIEEHDASDDVAAIYRDIKRNFQIQFVPNFFRSQAACPEVLAATWNLVQGILLRDNHVPRTIKEMIFVAVANVRRCIYCEDAHLAFCKLLGVDRETTHRLVNAVDDLDPQKTRDVIRFATKVATEPKRLTEEDFETITRHGVTSAELVEIMAMACLAVFATTLADAAKLNVDDGFQQILTSPTRPTAQSR